MGPRLRAFNTRHALVNIRHSSGPGHSAHRHCELPHIACFLAISHAAKAKIRDVLSKGITKLQSISTETGIDPISRERK
jgi:hypothetical protein